MTETLTPIGDNFRVNTNTPGIQNNSTTTALADGGFVVVWQSVGQDGSGLGIYAQRYDQNGNPVGDEFQINQETFDDQSTPSVAARPDGGFVVTWVSEGQEGPEGEIFARVYDANGDALEDEFHVNTFVQGAQSEPVVAVQEDGSFLIVWTTSLGSLGGRRFSPTGEPLEDFFPVGPALDFPQQNASVTALADGAYAVSGTSEFGITLQIVHPFPGGSQLIFENEFGNGPGTADQTKITQLPDGEFLLTWIDHDSLPYNQVFSMLFHEEGFDLLGPVPLFGESDLPNELEDYDITVLADGSLVVFVHVVATDFGNPSGGEVLAYHLDSIEVVPDPFQILDVTSLEANEHVGEPSLTQLADGSLVLTWSSENTDGEADIGVSAQLFEGQPLPEPASIIIPENIGAPPPAGDEFQVNTYTEDSQSGSVAVTLANGDFVVLYNSWQGPVGQGDIFGQRYSTDGTPIGDEFLVNQNTEDRQFTGHAVATPDGGFAVIWYHYRSVSPANADHRLGFQRFDANGDPLGEEVSFAQDPEFRSRKPAIAVLPDGTYVASWAADTIASSFPNRVFVQHLDAQGNPVGPQFEAGTTSLGGIEPPEIVVLNDGSFIISWATGARRYSDSEDTVGTAFDLTPFDDSNGDYRRMIELADGGFVAVFTLQVDSNEGTALFAQRFDADGVAVGETFQVNTNEIPFRPEPDVAALINGGFVVVWEGNHVEDDARSIYGQEFTADGERLGAEFSVSSELPWAQHYPSVTGLPDGGFTVSWTSNNQDGDGSGVFARIFEAQIEGGDRRDRLEGTSGDDSIHGHNNNDTLIGRDGDDSLSGGNGHDRLYGHNGNDTLLGEAGRDKLYSGDGEDVLFGGDGDDVLNGGRGAVQLIGGEGADIFHFRRSNQSTTDAYDTIHDFESGVDHIYLGRTSSDLQFVGEDAFSGTAHEVRATVIDGNTMVEVDTNGDGQADMAIELIGVYGLTNDDFIF